MERYYQNDEIKEVRENVNWYKLVHSLGLKIDEKRAKPSEIWVHSPFTEDKTASLHINLQHGGWYCHATSQGSGPIELIQKIYQLKLSEACQWLLDHGVSYLGSSENKNFGSEKEKELVPLPFGEELDQIKSPLPVKKFGKTPNVPTKFNLVPYFSQQGTHPEFVNRELSANTCHYLGCGYLVESSNSFLKNRIVFQVRSIYQDSEGNFQPNILTHLGRATTQEQETTHGKWSHYTGFTKTLELYNLDKILLDTQARYQAQKIGSICIVEGCFDLAKLVEAGIKNCVATFGAHLDRNQLPRFQLIAKELGITRFNLFYDRDFAGTSGKTRAQNTLQEAGYHVTAFDWNQTLPNGKKIPITITDPCTLSTTQLQWLRKTGKI